MFSSKRGLLLAIGFLCIFLLPVNPAWGYGFSGKYEGKWKVENQAAGTITFTVDQSGKISDGVWDFQPSAIGTGQVDESGAITIKFEQAKRFSVVITGKIDAFLKAKGAMLVKFRRRDYQGEWTAVGRELRTDIALKNVKVVGPKRGSINEPNIFGATISPADSSGPITYTWSPEPDRGQGEAQVVYTWPDAAPKTIKVTVSNLKGSAAAAGEHKIIIVKEPPAEYWPNGAPDFAWKTKKPEELGWDSAKLKKVVDYAFGVPGKEDIQNTDSFLVVVDGYIVAERYGKKLDRNYMRTIASAGKPITGILIGIARDKGLVDIHESMSDYFPDLSFLKGSGDTIWHHLTMTSGLSGKGGGNGKVIHFHYDPGLNWTYNTDAYHMLYEVIRKTAAKESGKGEREVLEVSKEWLFDVIGMENATYRIVPPKPHNTTRVATPILTARAMARFGMMVMRNGEWNGEQVISREYLKQATAPSQKLNPAYGYLFWLNGQEKLVRARGLEITPPWMYTYGPKDAFGCHGAGGQQIIIIPSLKTVVIRQGDTAQIETKYTDDTFYNQMFKRLMAAAPGTAMISVGKPEGGYISPAGDVYVAKGMGHKFWFMADQGHRIEDVIIDGRSVGPVEEYEFNKVTGQHTIEAVFKKGDYAAPVVRRTIPADKARNMALNESINVYFNKAMDAASVQAAFKVVDMKGNLVPGEVTVTDIGARVRYFATFKPAGKYAPDTTYMAVIGPQAKDTSGNPLNVEYNWIFKTGKRQ